jgi:hypothetical protein
MIARPHHLAALIAFAATLAAQQPVTVSLSTPAPSPAQATAVTIGNPGNTSYTYFVITNYPGGSVISAPAVVQFAPAALTGTNYIQIGWTPLSGATSYDVVRGASFSGSCTACAVATGLTANSAQDKGAALSSYTVGAQGSQGTGSLYINTRDYAPPQMRKVVNGVDSAVGAANPCTNSAAVGYVATATATGINPPCSWQASGSQPGALPGPTTGTPGQFVTVGTGGGFGTPVNQTGSASNGQILANVGGAVGGVTTGSVAGQPLYSSGSGAFAPTPLYPTGLLAEYRFDSGNTITDYSGAGNAGAVVGSPTISGGSVSGFSAGNYITTPVTGAKTIQFLADFSSVPTMTIGQWAPLYGASVGSGSYLHLFSRDGSGGVYNNSRITVFTSSETQTGDSLYGLHVVTYVLDASADTLYIDGYPAINYFQRGGNAAKTQSGMAIGADTGYNLFFPGKIYEYAAWSGELTAAQVMQSAQGVIDFKRAAGITIPLPQPTSTTSVLHCYGDSLTFGQDTVGGNVTAGGYPILLSLTGSFTIFNEGFSGQGSLTAQASVPGLIYPQLATLAQQNIVVLWIGTNNIIGGTTPATVAAWNIATAQGLIKAGFKVLMLPMISRTGSVNGQTNDVWAAQLNVLLSAAAASAGYTYVTLSTLLTAPGSYSNTTYFLTDGIHLTDAAGYPLVASAVSAAINAMAGTAAITATSGSIGGSPLTASCSTGTVAIPGAATTQAAFASPNADITGGGATAFSVSARISSAGTATVYVCGTGTPAATTYLVRVF